MGRCKFSLKMMKGPELFFQPRNTIVCKANKTSNFTLEETLRPLWKVTYYCGISLDWCSPVLNKSRIHKVLHYFGVFKTTTLLLSMMLFELVQVFKVIGTAPNIHGIIINILWLSPIPFAFITQINYLYGRRQFLEFFKDWKKLEKDFVVSQECDGTICDSRAIHWTMYAFYAGMTVASLVSLGFDMRSNPEATYLLSTYQIVRDTVPLSVVTAIHLICILIVWTLMSLGDVVPAFVYYHAALSISYLEKDVRAVFSKFILTDGVKEISVISENFSKSSSYSKQLEFLKPPSSLDAPIRSLWARYENVNQMVGRANILFGTLIITGMGVSVFMITILLYSVLYHLKDAVKTQMAHQLIPYLFNFIAIVFRFVSCTLIASNLQRYVSKLRTSLNCLLGKNWNQFTKQDRDLIRSFLSRLQSDPLVACPHGLYNITASTLLTILGLVVSYVIVLLQSN